MCRYCKKVSRSIVPRPFSFLVDISVRLLLVREAFPRFVALALVLRAGDTMIIINGAKTSIATPAPKPREKLTDGENVVDVGH